MKSGFVHNGLSGCGCGEKGLSDLAPNSWSYDIEIIRRYPEKGMPSAGIPFAIDVKINTPREYLVCTNATVVARAYNGPRKGQILSMAHIRTSNGYWCPGTGKLVFPNGWIPDSSKLIQLEMYYGSPQKSQLRAERADVITQPIHLGLSQQDGQKAGIYSRPDESAEEFVPNRLGITEAGFSFGSDFAKSTRNIAIIAGMGLAAYLVTPIVFKNIFNND